MKMRKLLAVIAIAIAAYLGYVDRGFRSWPAPAARTAQGDPVLARAFEDRLSNIEVQGRGRVARVLPDDVQGSRHQRFILRLASGQTILIAHNIDLAPRIASLREGDTVEFSGEYEWNPKGGVIHWTHRDPAGRHPAGWLKYDGRIYQ